MLPEVAYLEFLPLTNKGNRDAGEEGIKRNLKQS